jgi:hypothetical protein
VPIAGVVDALERIHAVLAEGGVIVDTQPVSAAPQVVGERGVLGALEMSDWSQTIAAVDEEIGRVVDCGLFDIGEERVVVVSDAYDDLAELVAEAGEWAGTDVPADLARLARTERGPARVDQDVRVRLLARR